MYDFNPYFTNDGSVGLYNKDFNDIYHSATGALTEAYEKFILPVDFEKLNCCGNLKVLDICYGIGYNSKSLLNFVLEKKLLKKNQKTFSEKKQGIGTIHTNKKSKNLSTLLSEYSDKIHTDNINVNYSKQNTISGINNTNNTETIHTNKISDVYIKAIDYDEILIYISPFIRTGVKNFNNDNLNFEYKQINKYLDSSKKIYKYKINDLINFLIFLKISEQKPEIYNNIAFNKLLECKNFKTFFNQKLRGIYELFKHETDNKSYITNKHLNLHNIYYRYITNRYKNYLKRYNLQDIKFEIKNEDARKTVIEDNNYYNLIFLDAFTPSKCPCLWSYEFLKELYNHLDDNGMLLTYASSPSIRAAMIEAGFCIGYNYNKRENKFMGTIAVKNKSLIKYKLSEYDLGLLKTTAGIFYRDPNLNSLNEAIIEYRNSEVKNSNRESTSHYQKIHKEDKCTLM